MNCSYLHYFPALCPVSTSEPWIMVPFRSVPGFMPSLFLALDNSLHLMVEYHWKKRTHVTGLNPIVHFWLCHTAHSTEKIVCSCWCTKNKSGRFTRKILCTCPGCKMTLGGSIPWLHKIVGVENITFILLGFISSQEDILTCEWQLAGQKLLLTMACLLRLQDTKVGVVSGQDRTTRDGCVH